MQSADEMRETRYNPSPYEVQILVSYIDQYFEYPDRSDERLQLVRDVTTKLSQINNRWKIRSVRLWFNNNKKYCSKVHQSHNTVTFQWPKPQTQPSTTASQIDLSASQGTFQPPPVPPDQMPLKKRQHLSRSASVDVFTRDQSLISMSASEDQKHRESQVSDALRETLNRQWKNDLSFLKPASATSDFLQYGFNSQEYSKEIAILSKSVSVDPVECFCSIETSCFDDGGVPLIVHFDSKSQSRFLWSYDFNIPLKLPSPVTSMAVDSDTLFLASGKSIIKLHSHSIESEPDVMQMDSPQILASSMALWGDCLYLGSRQSIFTISKDPSNTTQKAAIFKQLNGITSLTSLSSSLVAASCNHHAIYLLDKELQLTSVLSSHAGGITALSKFNDNCFVSGGSDCISYIWDCRCNLPVMQLERHYGAITMLYTRPKEESKVLITGGEDKLIRGFDLRGDKQLFNFNVGDGIPDSGFFLPDNSSFYLVTKEMVRTSAAGFHHYLDPSSYSFASPTPPSILFCAAFK